MSSSARHTGARVAPSGGSRAIELHAGGESQLSFIDNMDTPIYDISDSEDDERTRHGAPVASTGPAFFPGPKVAPTLEAAASFVESDDDDTRLGVNPPAGGLPLAPAFDDAVEDDASPEGPAPMRVLTEDDPFTGVYKRWFGTWNNPPESAFTDFTPGEYGMWQLERAPTTGTLHLQFFFVLEAGTRKSALKKLYPGAWFAPMRGTIEQCITYCSKSTSAVTPRRFREWGVKPMGRGARTDLMDAAALVLKAGAGAVAREMPWLYIKYSRGIQDLAREVPVQGDPEPEPVWRDWQRALITLLAGPADDRSILWYADGKGGEGKSTIVRHLVTNPDIAGSAIKLSGKVADMAYAYKGQKIVFFDVSRTMSENITHLAQFAEDLKNRLIFSTKYESQSKVFKCPHVVFFANILPPPGLWSDDRLKLTELTPCPAFTAASPVLPAPTTVAALALAAPAPVAPNPARKRTATEALMATATAAAVHKCDTEDCSKMVPIQYKYCFKHR